MSNDEELAREATEEPQIGVPLSAQIAPRIRGLLHGIALGEAVALDAHHGHPTGLRRSGVGTQLAAFTAESLIRGIGGLDRSGTDARLAALWTGLVRWAATQDLAPALTGMYAEMTGGHFPDGWLAQVPAMRKRRGSAPATVKALAGGIAGRPNAPVTSSSGVHGLVRSLPLAALPLGPDEHDHVAHLALNSAYLTHGHPEAAHATVAAILVLAPVLHGDADIADSVRYAAGAVAPHCLAVAQRIRDAADTAARKPNSLSEQLRLAPDRTALSALAAAIYARLSLPTLRDAAAFVTRGTTDQVGAAAIVGALFGADAHHEEDPTAIAGLELAWPLDVLASDLAVQLTAYPSGSPAHQPLPHWLERYPSW